MPDLLKWRTTIENNRNLSDCLLLYVNSTLTKAAPKLEMPAERKYTVALLKTLLPYTTTVSGTRSKARELYKAGDKYYSKKQILILRLTCSALIGFLCGNRKYKSSQDALFHSSPLNTMPLDIASLSIHADDELATTSDVAAPIHLSTTYRYDSDPSKLVPAADLSEGDKPLVYSRLHQPNTLRVEKVLGQILDGEAILYASGLAAFMSAMTYYNPKNVFIGDGYHGCHGILEILARNYNVKVHPLDSDPEILQPGDVVHLETPVNPHATAFDIEKYAKIAHSRGAYLLIDATFAPTPLQYPFEFGADMIMHSCTKYFGGHSDLLAGVLVTKDQKIKDALYRDRLLLGTNAGNLEIWLLLRSLRSFKLRITQQSKNAEAVIKYLVENIDSLPALKQVYHHSLQDEEFIQKQLPNGYSPVFSIEVADGDKARKLPSKLKLFNHATSLGGAESLIEWRCMSDSTVSRDLLRISIGLEDAEDLISDLKNALSS